MTLVAEPVSPSVIDLFKDHVQILREDPSWIMALRLRKIGHITNMITLPISIDVLVGHFLARDLSNQIERL